MVLYYFIINCSIQNVHVIYFLAPTVCSLPGVDIINAYSLVRVIFCGLYQCRNMTTCYTDCTFKWAHYILGHLGGAHGYGTRAHAWRML